MGQLIIKFKSEAQRETDPTYPHRSSGIQQGDREPAKPSEEVERTPILLKVHHKKAHSKEFTCCGS